MHHLVEKNVKIHSITQMIKTKLNQVMVYMVLRTSKLMFKNMDQSLQPLPFMKILLITNLEFIDTQLEKPLEDMPSKLSDGVRITGSS